MNRGTVQMGRRTNQMRRRADKRRRLSLAAVIRAGGPEIKRRLTLAAAVVALMMAPSLRAEVIHVPGDQPTIQAGIDAAANGDTVVVADGTYAGIGNKELDTGGKAISVRSANGPENCFIDCEGAGRAYSLSAGEGADTVIRGFTLRGGSWFTGGAFRCNGSSPSIRDNIFTGNRSGAGGGGAVYCAEGAAPEITGNVFTGNIAEGGPGGAICCFQSSPSIVGNTFDLNRSGDSGSAIYIEGGAPFIRSNSFTGNISSWSPDRGGMGGGTICCGLESSPTVKDNIISGNATSGGGGGILVIFSSAAIIGNTICGNTAEIQGAGIHCYWSTPVIGRNTITGNAIVGPPNDQKHGGGIYCTSCESEIRSNTITGNTSLYHGGGIMITYGDTIVEGNHLEGNEAAMYGGGFCFNGYDDLTMSDNTIIGNRAGDSGGGMAVEDSRLVMTNTLVAGNEAGGSGGGIYLLTFYQLPMMSNITIAGNSATDAGGGIFFDRSATLEISNSILWGNTAAEGSQVFLDEYAQLQISHSDVEGGEAGIPLGLYAVLDWGAGMIESDPLHVSGPLGVHYLSQTAAGQPADSPCLDAGTGKMVTGTTRTDHVQDNGILDMGYHYPDVRTVSADLTCVPATGTLPFTTLMRVTLTNVDEAGYRTIAARIDVTLAGGLGITGWKNGSTTLAPGDSRTTSWPQSIPAIPPMVGDNRFGLLARDVTPPPFNQPPYAPSGDTASAGCTVTGLAP